MVTFIIIFLSLKLFNNEINIYLNINKSFIYILNSLYFKY